MKKLIIVIFVALLSGCSSGVSTGIPLIITGFWQGQLLSNTGSKSVQFSGNITYNIVQTGNDFTGTASIVDPETNCWTGGAITGTITGNSFSLTLTDANGASITVTGSLNNTVMTGIYVSTSTAVAPPVDDGGDGGGDDGGDAGPVIGCPSHSGSFSTVKIG